MECLQLNNTVIRVHEHATGQKQGAERGPEQGVLGRSRGGFSTKVHVSVSSLGTPVEIRLTPGQERKLAKPNLSWRVTRP